MSDEQKENKCAVLFDCMDEASNPCVYRKKTASKYCDYRGYMHGGFCCNSVVAQTNKMVLLLQDAGFDVSRKGKVDNE